MKSQYKLLYDYMQSMWKFYAKIRYKRQYDFGIFPWFISNKDGGMRSNLWLKITARLVALMKI